MEKEKNFIFNPKIIALLKVSLFIILLILVFLTKKRLESDEGKKQIDKSIEFLEKH